MTQLRDRVSIGKILRKQRKIKGWPLVAVTGFLEDDYKITCSITNLAKLERGEFQCKANTLAALCLIYEIDISKVIYKSQ